MWQKSCRESFSVVKQCSGDFVAAGYNLQLKDRLQPFLGQSPERPGAFCLLFALFCFVSFLSLKCEFSHTLVNA